MASAEVAGVTLIEGPEPVLAARAVDEVVEQAKAAAADLRVVKVLAEDVDDAAVADLVAPSLFAEPVLVVITGADALVADTSDAVLGLLADRPEHLQLVITHAAKGNKGAAVLKRAREVADHTITVSEVKKSDRAGFVRKEFDTAGRQITNDAAQALVDAVGDDLVDVVAACRQLLADTTGRVDVETVRRYYAGRAEVKGWEVADAAIEGRTAEAVASLRSAVDTGTPPVLIVGSLAASLRTIVRLRNLPRGVRAADAARELGIQPWKLERVRRQAGPWNQARLADALAAVALADEAVKSDQDGRAKGYALERAVVAVCRGATGDSEQP